ncbi:MAG: helix-turn-helix domain-containing protein [Oscillospiraceae bacterium]|jgi:carbohydrate diacid regulator|nr:helix-turn-helix domain-containing protein [Oscillospiraceae bacterium]
MLNKFFQGMVSKMSGSLERDIEITDNCLEIIAGTRAEDHGKIRDIGFAEISTSDTLSRDGYTYKVFGSKTLGEYALGIFGSDEVAVKLVNLLSVPLGAAAKFYGEKHSKSKFVKNIILDNVLPGDILIKAKSLKIKENVDRVCIILHFSSFPEGVEVMDLIQKVFPDGSKDFIISLSEDEIVVVKEIGKGIESKWLEKLASSLIGTLATEHYVRCVAGIGTIVSSIEDVRDSYCSAQVALEVRKVFETEKVVAVYNQLGIARLIYQLPVSLCNVFLKEVFKKCTVDAIDNELMFTINKFFENSLNISETARKLFVHRNTLVYRIEKIKRVTGLDLRDFEDSIVFKVALMVNKYLKESRVSSGGRR